MKAPKVNDLPKIVLVITIGTSTLKLFTKIFTPIIKQLYKQFCVS